MRQPYGNELWHAKQYAHKYIKREGTPGNYRYWYPTDYRDISSNGRYGTATAYARGKNGVGVKASNLGPGLEKDIKTLSLGGGPAETIKNLTNYTVSNVTGKPAEFYFSNAYFGKNPRLFDKASQIYREGQSDLNAGYRERMASDRRRGAEAINREQKYNTERKVVRGAQRVYNDASKWATGAANDAARWGGQAYRDASKWATGAVNDAARWGGQAYRDASKWVNNAIKDTGNAAKTAVSAISTAASSAYNAGKSFIEGLFGKK